MVSWRLRKTYKSLRYGHNDIKRYGHVVVKRFTFNGEILSVAGWSWDREHKTDQRYLKLINKKGEVVYEVEIEGLQCSDLPPDIGISGRFLPGFDVKIWVSSVDPLDVYLYHVSSHLETRTLLGTITPSDDGSTYTQAITLDEFMIKPYPKIDNKLGHKVDLIIPIFNGYEYLEPLLESIKQTNVSFRAFLINDCSTDKRVEEMLVKLTNSDERFTLIQNEANLGFVASVNRGLHCAKNDVVLLNTDVVLPSGWLERLMRPIWTDESIASCTPYTNSGTICSFPVFCEDNTLITGMNVQEIDECFSAIDPVYPEIPTGVGFCMAMSYNALKEVGFLDEEAYGRGYGEENDWCRRAASLGYKNVHVDDLFVFHNHGGTFVSEEKKQLISDHSKILSERFPDYDSLVHDYVVQDPLKLERKLLFGRVLLNHPAKTIIALDHDLGGGATDYLVGQKDTLQKQGYRFIIMRYKSDLACYCMDIYFGELSARLYALDIETFFEGIHRCDEIWINEVVGYPNVASLFSFLITYKSENCCTLKFLLHDYYALCESYNLLDFRGVFCNLPDHARCNHCFHFIRSGEWRTNGISEYRNCWRQFLSTCDTIVVFSTSSEGLLRRVYPELDNIALRPHVIEELLPLNKKREEGQKLIIGVLGAIAYHKGLDVLEEIVTYLEKQQEDIELKIIGYTDGTYKNLRKLETGPYVRSDLPQIALNESIDIFFIPSICPETFSYTAAEVVSMGYPLAVFDLGAPAERCADYDDGLIIPLGSTAPEIIELIKDFMQTRMENM